MRMPNVAYRYWDDGLLSIDCLAAAEPKLAVFALPTIETTTLLGIDVSEYQGDIDFDQVKGAGANFVFIKATEGATIVDANFASNWKAAKAAGITRGAYHFFRPEEDLQSQIDIFVTTLGTLDAGDLPPVLDLEVPEDWAQFTEAQRETMILGWLQAVEAKLGIKPIIYIDDSMATDTLSSPESFKDYLLWVADYTASLVPNVPLPWTVWTFWQYSDTGAIAGIDGAVDLDRFLGTPADLAQLLFVPAAVSLLN